MKEHRGKIMIAFAWFISALCSAPQVISLFDKNFDLFKGLRYSRHFQSFIHIMKRNKFDFNVYLLIHVEEEKNMNKGDEISWNFFWNSIMGFLLAHNKKTDTAIILKMWEVYAYGNFFLMKYCGY